MWFLNSFLWPLKFAVIKREVGEVKCCICDHFVQVVMEDHYHSQRDNLSLRANVVRCPMDAFTFTYMLSKEIMTHRFIFDAAFHFTLRVEGWCPKRLTVAWWFCIQFYTHHWVIQYLELPFGKKYSYLNVPLELYFIISTFHIQT